MATKFTDIDTDFNQSSNKALLGGLANNAFAFLFNGLKLELTESGEIDPAKYSFVQLNHASTLIAATIAAPVEGQLMVITQTDSGTAGHTVTLSAGTFDGTNDVATFDALGETLILFGVTDASYVIVENIGSVSMS